MLANQVGEIRGWEAVIMEEEEEIPPSELNSSVELQTSAARSDATMDLRSDFQTQLRRIK